MGDPKRIPKFKDEESEAKWYDEHHDEMPDYLRFKPKEEKPLAERLGLDPKEKPATRLVSIRLLEDTIEKASQNAERIGIGYQTLIKDLIRDGLKRLEAHDRNNALIIGLPQDIFDDLIAVSEEEGVSVDVLVASLLTRFIYGKDRADSERQSINAGRKPKKVMKSKSTAVSERSSINQKRQRR